MATRFLYFDLGNVLLNFDQQRACQQMGDVSNVSAERVRQVVFDDGLEDQLERGEITFSQFYKCYSEATGTNADFDQLMLASSEIFELNVPIVPIVAHLRAAGYPLGILSNTCQPHWDYCSCGRYRIIPTLFHHVILSFEVGAMKPDPRIYQAAIKAANLPPEEIFFTDDRLENVDAAAACGLDAVHYQTPQSLIGELARRGVRFNL